jgi:hypothetical protein
MPGAHRDYEIIVQAMSLYWAKARSTIEDFSDAFAGHTLPG